MPLLAKTKQGFASDVMVTDQMPCYGAVKTSMGLSARLQQCLRNNNRTGIRTSRREDASTRCRLFKSPLVSATLPVCRRPSTAPLTSSTIYILSIHGLVTSLAWARVSHPASRGFAPARSRGSNVSKVSPKSHVLQRGKDWEGLLRQHSRRRREAPSSPGKTCTSRAPAGSRRTVGFTSREATNQ
jgi:hypothetical protein